MLKCRSCSGRKSHALRERRQSLTDNVRPQWRPGATEEHPTLTRCLLIDVRLRRVLVEDVVHPRLEERAIPVHLDRILQR